MGRDWAVKGLKRINSKQAKIDLKFNGFTRHLFAFGRKVVHLYFKNSEGDQETGELEKVTEAGAKAKKRNASKRKGRSWERRLWSDWDSGNQEERRDTMGSKSVAILSERF